MISSAISADLGRQEALQNSQEALATVTGIVDGTGSFGAAAGQVMHFLKACLELFFLVLKHFNLEVANLRLLCKFLKTKFV